MRLLILTILCCPSLLFAQTYSISGRVTTPEGTPLITASVYIHETLKGTITNEEGYYELQNVSPGNYHLHVEYLGYEAAGKNIRITDEDIVANFVLKESSLEISEVVIEANPLKTKQREHSQDIEVVNETFLERTSGNTLLQSLEQIPGISSIDIGAGISKPVIRGMSFNRVVVADKGIKQEGQQWGADHGLEIDAYDIKRVEIVKGPSSILYGSDAIGGVINILPPLVPKKNTLKGEIIAEGKSNNHLLGGSFMLEGNKNDNFFEARISAQNYGNYKVPADSFTFNTFTLPIYKNELKNTAGEEFSYTGTVGIRRRWGKMSITGSKISQKAGFFPGAFGRPRPYAPDDDPRDIALPSQSVDHYKLIYNSNILVKGNWLEWDVGWQNNIRREFAVPHSQGGAPLPGHNLHLEMKLQTYSANLRYHYHIKEKLKHVYGLSGQYQVNAIGGYEFLIPNFTTWAAGGYFYQEYKISENKNINTGLRYDAGSISTEAYYEPVWENGAVSGMNERAPAVDDFFHNFSAAAGLSWQPSELLNLKTHTAVSYRIPSPVELTANGIHHGTFRHEKGTPTLDSERGFHLDLSGTYRKKDWLVEISPYAGYFSNFIFLSPTGKFSSLPEAGQIYQYRQSNAFFAGKELSAEYHIRKHIHLGIGAEYVFAHNLDEGYPLPFIPPFSAVADVEYTLPEKSKRVDDVYVNFSAHAYAAQNRTARNEPETPGYTLLNFGSGLTFYFKQQPLKLIFNIRNLLNSAHLNHLSHYRIINLPDPGRSFSLRLSVPFEIWKE